MINWFRINGVTKFVILTLFAFILMNLMNLMAYFHAYRFTHFTNSKKINPTDSKNIKLSEKIKVLLFGIENPRPQNDLEPYEDHEVIYIDGSINTECWRIEASKSKGQVAIFHGYSQSKSGMYHIAKEFLNLGFSVLLVDFMGSGGSEGNKSTIGYNESDQVKACYDYLWEFGNGEDIYMYGTSMGSVAILKALKDHDIKPTGVILECPYGSLNKAVGNRFRNMGLPEWPFAQLLVFWGGIQHGFWGFSHNSVEYARYVNVPTLILRGKEDFNVTHEEVQAVYTNLKGSKILKEYEKTGHTDIYSNNVHEWREDISEFIETTKLGLGHFKK